jgi:hypothetical protein
MLSHACFSCSELHTSVHAWTDSRVWVVFEQKQDNTTGKRGATYHVLGLDVEGELDVHQLALHRLRVVVVQRHAVSESHDLSDTDTS